MRYDYKGSWNCDSRCDIEAHRRSDGKYVFVATELPDNPGTSVTNFAEYLATARRRQYGLQADDVIWIEHYPEAKDRWKEEFDVVRFLSPGPAPHGMREVLVLHPESFDRFIPP